MQRLTQLQLILAARDTIQAIKPVDLVSENVSIKTAATQALDGLERWMRIAAKEYQEDCKSEELAASSESPFLKHRDKILAGYSTAIRLQDLVLHLYNHRHKVDLPNLLRNADSLHREVAVELMRGYAENGEGDQSFMALAEQILANRKGA